MSVLGSREQMCIEPNIKKLPSNAARTGGCRTLVSQKKCQYYNSVQAIKYNTSAYKSMDIEELVTFGVTHTYLTHYFLFEVF